MAQVDSLKAEIDFNQKLFFAVLTALVALVSWLAGNYSTTSHMLIGSGIIISVVLSYSAGNQYLLVKRLIAELKDVE